VLSAADAAAFFWIGVVCFGICELGNLVCHWRLRQAPYGLVFELVSCPNDTHLRYWCGQDLH